MLFGPDGALLEASSSPYKLIGSVEQLKQYCRTFRTGQVIAIDTETSGLSPYNGDYLAGISLSRGAGDGVYIPLRHDYSSNLPLGAVKNVLQPLLLSSDFRWTGWHLKFDLHFLSQAGFEFNFRQLDDALVMLFLIDAEIESKKLKDVACALLRPDADRFQTYLHAFIAHHKIPEGCYAKVPAAVICDYAASDTDYTHQLDTILRPIIKASSRLSRLYDTELEMLRILFNMEKHGVYVDTVKLFQLERDLERELARLRVEMQQAVGHPFDMDSAQAVSELLFNELKLVSAAKTKTGKEQVDRLALVRLIGQHPVVGLLLEYRKLDKLYSTYAVGLQEQQVGGVIHTSFNSTIARTSRLSSSNPNIQNIPSKDSRVRSCFITPPDSPYFIVDIDQSQVEVRVIADYTKDPTLLRAFQEGRDVHADICSKFFGVPEEHFKMDPVPAEATAKRKLSKPVTFGMSYDVTPDGLQDYLESWGIRVTKEYAHELWNGFWAALPVMKAGKEAIVRYCRTVGYAETMYGFRRNLPGLNAHEDWVREQAERRCFNTHIQGTCGGMLKEAMIRCDKTLEGTQSRMVLTVHDELFFYIHPHDKQLIPQLKANMEYYPFISVPIIAEVSYSTVNWVDQKALKI